MRARDCVWRQPSDADFGPSIQLNSKPADYRVNSVEQEQVRRGRGHNRNTPNKDASQRKCLARFGPQPKCRINGRLCQAQTLRGVVDLGVVNHIMCKS